MKELLERRRAAHEAWRSRGAEPREAGDLAELLERLDRRLAELRSEAAGSLALLDDEVPAGTPYESPAEEARAAERLAEAHERRDWQTVLDVVVRLQAGQERLWEELGGRPQRAMRSRPSRSLPGQDDDVSTPRRGPFLGGGVGAAPPPPAPPPPRAADDSVETLERTPHMDLSAEPPLPPGAEFTATVWADREGQRQGETSEGISIAAPASVRSFDLDVQLLTSAHFAVTARPALPLTLDRDEDASNRLEFRLRVLAADELAALGDEVADPARGYLSATFRYQGRPAGKVTRLVDLAVPVAAEAVRPEPDVTAAPQAAVAFEAVEELPDLTVQIVADPTDPERRFHCLLETPWLDLSEDEASGRWTLRSTTSEIVTSYMALFTAKGKSDAQRLAALRGAGGDFFTSAPENFKAIYWRLIDEHGPPATLALVTEEPHYPWELMIPHRRRPDGTTERRGPLGVETSVGRFIHGLSLSGPRRLPLVDSYAVAPEYQGRRALPHAQEEAEMVTRLFSGEAIRPVTFERLDEALTAKAVSLVHFACHGKQTSGVQQSIYLDDDAELSSVEVSGMDGFRAAFERGRPLVFLNACEVGRLEPALAAVGGFAATFIELGARAVVAPLWSVKDTLAHEVATEFYRRLGEEPGVRLSEILRELRQRSYEGDQAGEDTYAAYCFYGDPLATRAV